jgi:hypothetical protein
MLGFILFNMLFNENKSNSKGSKYIPYPPKSLIKLTKKYYKNKPITLK